LTHDDYHGHPDNPPSCDAYLAKYDRRCPLEEMQEGARMEPRTHYVPRTDGGVNHHECCTVIMDNVMVGWLCDLEKENR